MSSPSETSKAKYRRIVLKISGEALRESGSKDNISPQIVQGIAKQVLAVQQLGVGVGVAAQPRDEPHPAPHVPGRVGVERAG
jgi:hypothetical protein